MNKNATLKMCYLPRCCLSYPLKVVVSLKKNENPFGICQKLGLKIWPNITVGVYFCNQNFHSLSWGGWGVWCSNFYIPNKLTQNNDMRFVISVPSKTVSLGQTFILWNQSTDKNKASTEYLISLLTVNKERSNQTYYYGWGQENNTRMRVT